MNYPTIWNPLQPYRNRNYMCAKLDQYTFEQLNSIDAAFLFSVGCLDALDSIPAGSTKCGKWQPILSYVQRNELGTSPQQRKERDDHIRQIIDEIIAEEKQRKWDALGGLVMP